jgi:cytochrome c peroxidase
MRGAVLWMSVLATVAVAAKLQIPLGLDAYVPVPEDNPLTQEKVALGRKLFSDTRLSRDQKVACATCHDPKSAFTDAKPVAVGVFGRKGNRRVPTLVNRAYGKAFFWDGRISTLEEQVIQPIVNPKEMDMTLEEVVARLQPMQISPRGVAQALASYVRTILSGDSPYDRYVAGDRGALSEEARSGLAIFQGKGNCTFCHLGPNLSDERFHNTGIAWRDGKFSDPGRFTVTKNDEDLGAFKTPTLRNVTRKPPYMHDGSLATLEEVVDHYDKGGNPNPNLDPEIRPLHLTEAEKHALVAFLNSLNGTIREGMLLSPGS